METDLTLQSRAESTVTIENTKLYLLMETIPDIPKESKLKTSCGKMHKHSFAEIFICRSGHITIKTELRYISLDAGEMLLVPRDYLHTIDRTSSDDSQWCSVGIYLVRIKRNNAYDIYSRYAKFCYAKQPILIIDCAWLCELIYNVNMRQHESCDSLAALQAASVLSYLAQDSLPIRTSEQDIQAPGGDIKRIAHIEYIIETQYSKDFDLKKIADSLLISPSQLTRVVKKHFGMTLYQLILKKRIAAAKNLLDENRLSIAEISRNVGFHSLSAFYRIFTDETGIPPNKYKNGGDHET